MWKEHLTKVQKEDIERHNILELQKQLYEAYKRIAELNAQVNKLEQKVKDGKGTSYPDHFC